MPNKTNINLDVQNVHIKTPNFFLAALLCSVLFVIESGGSPDPAHTDFKIMPRFEKGRPITQFQSEHVI